MTKTLTINDESVAGVVLHQILIDIESEIITVEELIKLRVSHEVELFNKQSKSHHFSGLVQPSDTEVTLNGYKLKKKRQVDAEKQSYIAMKAFQENGFFILVDNMQVEDLKHEIHLDENTAVSFVRLTPLVGG